MFAEPGEDCFQCRQHTSRAFGANDPIPQRFEFLPAARVTDMAQSPEEVVFSPRAPEDRSPAIEIAIGAPVPGLQTLRRHPGRAENYVAGVEQIPLIAGPKPLSRQ